MERRAGRDRRRLYPKGLDASMLADSDDKHMPELHHSRAKNMTVLVAGDAAAMKRRRQHCPDFTSGMIMITGIDLPDELLETDQSICLRRALKVTTPTFSDSRSSNYRIYAMTFSASIVDRKPHERW
jgi:hypothetical protein